MITPTTKQLECWMAVHRITIAHFNGHLEVVAWAPDNKIIEQILIMHARQEMHEEQHRAKNLLMGCEAIAKALCLASPQRALNL